MTRPAPFALATGATGRSWSHPIATLMLLGFYKLEH